MSMRRNFSAILRAVELLPITDPAIEEKRALFRQHVWVIRNNRNIHFLTRKSALLCLAELGDMLQCQ